MEKNLPPIPAKRYFTIGEVGDLCGVKPHVLRYWEQEFSQLRPMKRRGNRRYYQHHEVLMIRRIRELLHDQGFTISGARIKLQELTQGDRDRRTAEERNQCFAMDATLKEGTEQHIQIESVLAFGVSGADALAWKDVKRELMEIRSLLSGNP